LCDDRLAARGEGLTRHAAAQPARRRDGHVSSRPAGDRRGRLPRRRRPRVRRRDRGHRSGGGAARVVRTVFLFRSGRDRSRRKRAHMTKWFAIAIGAVVTYAVVTSWPEIVRYRRIRAM